MIIKIIIKLSKIHQLFPMKKIIYILIHLWSNPRKKKILNKIDFDLYLAYLARKFE